MFPSADAMHLLLALSRGDPLTADAGALVVRMPEGDWRPPPEAMDELERVAWVDTTTDPARITDRGRYGLRRWVAKTLGPGEWRITGVRVADQQGGRGR